jgi:hypothetical protein
MPESNVKSVKKDVAKSQCQEKSAYPETQAGLKKVNVFFINASGFEKVNVFMCIDQIRVCGHGILIKYSISTNGVVNVATLLRSI